MITTHIVETPYDIVITKLDCVLGRFPKHTLQDADDFLWRLEDMLKGLGQNVEVSFYESVEV